MANAGTTDDWPAILLRIRKGREWTQGDLANNLGVTSRAISNWERGTTEPRRVHRRRLLELLAGLPDEGAAVA